ncbi:MAG: hypothetical protein RIB58_10265 [Phycisphaerales bacterium]
MHAEGLRARREELLASREEFLASTEEFLASTEEFLTRPEEFWASTEEFLTRPEEFLASTEELLACRKLFLVHPKLFLGAPGRFLYPDLRPKELSAKCTNATPGKLAVARASARGDGAGMGGAQLVGERESKERYQERPKRHTNRPATIPKTRPYGLKCGRSRWTAASSITCSSCRVATPKAVPDRPLGAPKIKVGATAAMTVASQLRIKITII